ncbi:hypothetical protein [Planctomyces sp. SH-PL14]|uniref:hypothetical protein n=1 Tax=Planctomyces sp. SH-PL14 TaxID=1632864 RepID=UPI00078C12CB|nr:hypothetical protein [Planctomyces sp. SH-PL14]AMV16533.1 hypothetical protein VT03_01495 [Planctomyces sp. SH-PL14]
MARKRFKLTWQTGAGRRGRWKKMYKGRILYFDGGSGKSDAEAYSRALADFERQKLLIDAEVAFEKPHRAEYERAIAEWERVLLAARTVEDQSAAIVAAAKIDDLHRRMNSRKPPGVSRRTDYPVRRFGLRIGQIQAPLAQSDVAKVARSAAVDLVDELGVAEDREEELERIVERYISNVIWKDRLAAASVQPSQETPRESTLKAFVDRYVVKRRESGITPTAADNIRRHLQYMQRKLGPGLDASAVGGKHVDDLHQALLQDCEGKRFTKTYAADIFKTAKMFIRWLHETDVLHQLPKNLTSRALRITREPPVIKTYTVEQIRELFAAAPEDLKLYILLALNCGMTQVDISALKPESVDWDAGTLTRKRGKTIHFERVPTVTYKLWGITLRLLKKLRSNDPNHLLLSSNGKTLRGEELRNGKLVRRNPIRVAFVRLRKSLGQSGDFKSLKKTSASLLRDNAEFNGVEAVFLDHAPKSMSDRHYAGVPTTLLARALGWLEGRYCLHVTV